MCVWIDPWQVAAFLPIIFKSLDNKVIFVSNVHKPIFRSSSVRGTHLTIVDSPHKGPAIWTYGVISVVSLKKKPCWLNLLMSVIWGTMLMWHHCIMFGCFIPTVTKCWKSFYDISELLNLPIDNLLDLILCTIPGTKHSDCCPYAHKYVIKHDTHQIILLCYQYRYCYTK